MWQAYVRNVFIPSVEKCFRIRTYKLKILPVTEYFFKRSKKSFHVQIEYLFPDPLKIISFGLQFHECLQVIKKGIYFPKSLAIMDTFRKFGKKNVERYKRVTISRKT